MPGSNLDAVLGRAIRDQAFRKRLLSDPKGVASEYKLSKDEQTQLEHINQKEADKFLEGVAGGRTIRYCTSKSCYESG